jgi:hypothetical protein
MKKFITPRSPEFNAVWDALTSVLEVPEGVTSLTLHLSHEDIVTLDLTYFPKFIGELPENEPDKN